MANNILDTPLFLYIVIAVLICLLGILVYRLRKVRLMLKSLATEARNIAMGKLDHPLDIYGLDEMGEMRRSFEQMRVSLQARLDELNRLLVASQGVASSLKLSDALEPVLKAVADSGASSARIVLVRDMIPSPVEIPIRFASGTEKDVYMHLDQQILSLTEGQERLVMAALSRTRGLDLDLNLPNPESLIAIALRHESRYYGVLWAGYKQQHVFSESDIRFISTLASQAALAVANIRLFLTVETSRRQLEAILNSTPDPVLVTDASNRLILANPAAGHVFGVTIRRGERPDLERTIQVKELNDLLMLSPDEQRSVEIRMPDGKIYLATASAMTAEERTVGRICVLRDITSLRELYEDLKRRSLINERMASSQHIKDTSRSILETLRSAGAKTARIILLPEEFPEPRIEFSLSYGLGALSDSYASFDNEIIKFKKAREDG